MSVYLSVYQSACQSNCQFVCQSICLSVWLSVSSLCVWQSICLYINHYVCMYSRMPLGSKSIKSFRLYVCLSVCLSISLSACLPVCMSVYQSVCLSVCLSISMSVYQSVCLSVCLFVYQSVCLSVCLSVCMSVSSTCLNFYRRCSPPSQRCISSAVRKCSTTDVTYYIDHTPLTCLCLRQRNGNAFFRRGKATYVEEPLIRYLEKLSGAHKSKNKWMNKLIYELKNGRIN